MICVKCAQSKDDNIAPTCHCGGAYRASLNKGEMRTKLKMIKSGKWSESHPDIAPLMEKCSDGSSPAPDGGRIRPVYPRPLVDAVAARRIPIGRDHTQHQRISILYFPHLLAHSLVPLDLYYCIITALQGLRVLK